MLMELEDNDEENKFREIMVDILHNLLLWVSNVLSESKENGIHFSI
jgi:hypothetical protein